MAELISEPAHLPDGFTGETIRPNDPAFDSARAMYSASIDRRPALIARPRSAADVVDVVNYARDNDLPLAVRCGGHSIAGTSIVEDGVLLDLSSMKGVHVDAARKTAVAQAGVLWGEFDRDTQLYGLATPGGRVTTTGLGGFTLGGGYGWLSTKHGLTCDNLVGADVVTADGRMVHASEAENADLLWGLRGAGANFGVVTSYELRLHPVGPTILGGMMVLPNDGVGGVMREARDYLARTPDDVASAFATVLAPPEPFVPPELVGKPVWAILVAYVGSELEEGEELLAPLRDLMSGGVDLVQPMPYTAFQAMIDGFNPRGLYNYHRGMHLHALPDDVVEAYLEVGQTIGSPVTQGVIFCNGGAISRVAEDDTAAGNRAAPYMAHPIAAWAQPEGADHEMAWVHRFSEAFAPAATGGVYLNFEPGVDDASVHSGYGSAKYRRLVELKDAWDPQNLFRANHNIAPSGWQPAR